MAQLLLKGTTLTEGIAFGTVCLYQEDLLDAAPHYDIAAADIPRENNRFLEARNKTRDELRALYETVAKRLSTIEAEVFNMHLLILDDPAFVNEAERIIAQQHINAEHAIVQVVKIYEEKFKVLPNHYFRERIQDINDIARRVIKNLGREHAGFMCASCHQGPVIVAASQLTSTFIAGLHHTKCAGIIAEKGSPISHAAILARAMGVPALINVEGLLPALGCGAEVIVDATSGFVYISPDEGIRADYEKTLARLREQKKKEPRRGVVSTRDGVVIKLFANAGTVFDITHAREHGIRDVGLFRTEFLFLERPEEPTVEEQAAVYRNIIDSVEGTVTFRLLDIGGDKALDFLTLPKEENPNLGLRGSRIYDLYPDLIDHQIEALLRAKGNKPLHILVPMISTVREFRSVKEKILKKLRDLKALISIDEANLKIGCMIEVPSAVYLLRHLYEEADFMSIGTNDLIQYVMGVDRGNSRLGDLSSPFQPAVLKVLSDIARTVPGGKKEIVVCGEAASDPEMAKALVGFGYRNLSINVHVVDRIDEALRHSTLPQLEERAQSLLRMETLEHIVELLVKK